MANKYPFSGDIRDPDRKEPNPFADDSPDLNRSPTDAGEKDPYQPTCHGLDYSPQYEAFGMDRTTVGLICGLIGIVLSLASWPLVGSFLFYGFGLVFSSFSLAGSIPAFILGGQDARAMDQGAMRTKRRGRVSVVWWLGLLGILNSLVLIAIAIWPLVTL